MPTIHDEDFVHGAETSGAALRGVALSADFGVVVIDDDPRLRTRPGTSRPYPRQPCTSRPARTRRTTAACRRDPAARQARSAPGWAAPG